MNIRKFLNPLKLLIYPFIVVVHAIRAYRQMNNMKKYIISGQVTISPEVPKGLFTIDVRSALLRTVFDGSYEKEIMSNLSSLTLQAGSIVNIVAHACSQQ